MQSADRTQQVCINTYLNVHLKIILRCVIIQLPREAETKDPPYKIKTVTATS